MLSICFWSCSTAVSLVASESDDTRETRGKSSQASQIFEHIIIKEQRKTRQLDLRYVKQFMTEAHYWHSWSSIMEHFFLHFVVFYLFSPASSSLGSAEASSWPAAGLPAARTLLWTPWLDLLNEAAPTWTLAIYLPPSSLPSLSLSLPSSSSHPPSHLWKTGKNTEAICRTNSPASGVCVRLAPDTSCGGPVLTGARAGEQVETGRTRRCEALMSFHEREINKHWLICCINA